ncbi:MAG: HAD-IIB family hydrolase [Lachnospiraceae bacterium]|nr:HAD-IIB family hydrolase [Lachnospiraceae bacterium]
MIATDIDGTILPAGDREISAGIIEALKDAAAAGVIVVPATGRLYSNMPKQLLDIPDIRYIITSNGASILDRKEGGPVYQQLIPAALGAELLRKLSRYHVYTSAYLTDGVYNWSVLPEELKVNYAYRIPFFSQNPKDDLPAFVARHGVPVEKIFTAIFEEEEKERIRREMGDIPGIRITTSTRWNLEVNAAHADKGTALRWLADRLGIVRENILAMGDNENDLTMLAYAGVTAVPDNSSPALDCMAMYRLPDARTEEAVRFLKEILA